MPEALADDIKTIRPTKKQRAMLEYISAFISEHGYSPCYREIMRGCGYNSVATVALHVNSLIARGHLQKRDRSARSLEVVSDDANKPFLTNQIKIAEEKWLIELIESRFATVEISAQPEQADVDSLYVLVGALKVLGLEGAAQSFMPRLTKLKKQLLPT
jgi:SOS-response transcriptional repressor LexA